LQRFLTTANSAGSSNAIQDIERLLAINGDLEIELTVREMKLIVLLTKRRGEVVTRDELLNECWGLEYYPESRTLDQHVLNLRKKIEVDPSRPTLIETVRGAGYRFPG
jgi:two-component system, OmpR family, alkaline phosphatase synthesis response regulator PhoP